MFLLFVSALYNGHWGLIGGESFSTAFVFRVILLDSIVGPVGHRFWEKKNIYYFIPLNFAMFDDLKIQSYRNIFMDFLWMMNWTK